MRALRAVLFCFSVLLLHAIPALAAARRSSSQTRQRPPVDHLAAVKTRWQGLTYHQQQLQKDVTRELLRGGVRGTAFRDQLKDILKLNDEQLEDSTTTKSNFLGQLLGDGATFQAFGIPAWVKGFVVFFSFCGFVLAANLYIYARRPGDELTPLAPKRDQDAFKGLLYLLGTAVAGFSFAILGAMSGMLGFLWTGATFIILAVFEVMYLGVFEGNRYVRLAKITRSVPVFNLAMMLSLVMCFLTLGYGF